MPEKDLIIDADVSGDGTVTTKGAPYERHIDPRNDIDNYDGRGSGPLDSQGSSDNPVVFEMDADGHVQTADVSDPDTGEGGSDGKDSNSTEEKKDPKAKKSPSFKVEIDEKKFEAAKKIALDKSVEPVATQVFERITTDAKTIEMIGNWNKLTREEKGAALREDASMLGDGLKANIPLYQFYHWWKMMSAAKKRTLLYYGVLPMSEEDIEKVEENYKSRDRLAALGLKAAGFFLPEIKALDPVMAAYIGSAEFNSKLAKRVRASVREKLKVHNATEDFKQRAMKAAA